MKGETLLTSGERKSTIDFICSTNSLDCLQDTVLDEFSWLLGEDYKTNFREYSKRGIVNPMIVNTNHDGKQYSLSKTPSGEKLAIGNTRTIIDNNSNNKIYAYFDYPVIISPLYLCVFDFDEFAPEQFYNCLEETSAGNYKITKEGHYPLVVKIDVDAYLNRSVENEEYDEDFDSNDVSNILRRNKIRGPKNTLIHINKLVGGHISKKNMFEVIDTEDFDMSEQELKGFMKTYLQNFKSRK